MLRADAAKQRHELLRARARQLVGVAVPLDVALLHARKVPVQRLVEVFPAALAERQTHVKADDPPHAHADAFLQDRRDVFLRIVDERQNGRQPHDRRDAARAHGFQHLDAPLRVADIRLEDRAQLIVIGRERHLHHALGGLVDLVEQVDVAEDAVGLRLDRKAEAVVPNDFEAFAREPKFFFTVHVGIGHGASADHTRFSFGF